MKKACIRFLLVAAVVLTLSGCGEKAGTGTAGKYPQPETHYTSPTDPTDSSRTRSRRPQAPEKKCHHDPHLCRKIVSLSPV